MEGKVNPVSVLQAVDWFRSCGTSSKGRGGQLMPPIIVVAAVVTIVSTSKRRFGQHKG